MKLFSDLSFADFARAFLLLLLLTMWGETALALPEEAQDENPPMTDIQIVIDDFFGSESYWKNMVQCLVSSHIRIGDRFSEEVVNRLATVLKECRRFRSIHLDTMETETGLTLVVKVTPFRLIKNIRIMGKYPLFEKQILNVMTLYPGDAYIEEEIDKQAELIAGLYRKYGYVEPKVKIRSLPEEGGRYYILDITIEKGRPYRLLRLDIQGNQAFDDSTLRRRMKSVRIDNQKFSEKNFLEDVEKLKKYYLAHRFPDAVVTHQIKADPDTGEVDIRIAVNEGDRYDISFVGNQAFWNRTLRKDLAIFESGNRFGTGMRKSIRNIRERYIQAGYAEVNVKSEKETVKEAQITVRKIRILIDEGPRSIVRRIVVSGNRVFSLEQIQKQMLTRLSGWFHDGEFVPEIFEQDIAAVINLYRTKGYLDVVVEKAVEFSPDRMHVDIQLIIHEGIQTKVSGIILEGLSAVPQKKVLKNIKNQVGRPFNPNSLKDDEKRIAMMVSEKGHPYVQVSGTVEFNQGDRSQAHVSFLLHENKYIQRGQTFYAGNFRTKERILERELVQKPGDPFSLKNMVEGQQNIRSMNIFRSVTFNPVGLKDESDTIHLFTEVEEEKPYYFETSGGFSSEKGLYATSTIGDHNFFGLNKDFKIGGEVSETGYKGESRLFEPRFFGTRISSDLGVFVEREEPFNQVFGTDSRGADLVFSRKWRKRIKGSLGFHYEEREQYRREAYEVGGETFDKRGLVVLTPSISYDSRDNFLNPKNGSLLRTWVDLSRGLYNSLDDFYKFRTDLRGYATPVKRFTFAGRASFGTMEPFGSHGNIPEDQLFYLGGTSTVRGFDENLFLTNADNDPVGGRLMAVGNAETRIDLGSNFEFSLFYDVGYLDKTYCCSQADNVRDSVGAGLRYVTPVGAVGLAYGHKLNPEPDESSGRLHFSIGYTF